MDQREDWVIVKCMFCRKRDKLKRTQKRWREVKKKKKKKKKKGTWDRRDRSAARTQGCLNGDSLHKKPPILGDGG